MVTGGAARGERGRPILVTGVPRSGTTWLARWLAYAPGTALAGREPMNPRGRQYALAGTVDGWARITEPTPRQRRALKLAYRGLNPLVYSRYGARQWAGPLPWTRLVVKDPFAMMSIPAIVEVTGATPVLVYRHPGAVLASYRRMNWQPDLAELADIVAHARSRDGLDLPDLPAPGEATPAEEMGLFWSVLHDLALAGRTPETSLVVVSHSALAQGGTPSGRRLAEAVGLGWSQQMDAELSKESGQTPAADPTKLHNFDRSPAAVADEWRAKLTDQEIGEIEQVSAATLARLDSLRLA